METPTIESLMAARRDEAESILLPLGADRVKVEYTAGLISLFIAWWVNPIVGEKSCGGFGSTFDEALAAAKSQLVKHMEARPNLCPTCGGRTDGACKHTH